MYSVGEGDYVLIFINKLCIRVLCGKGVIWVLGEDKKTL